MSDRGAGGRATSRRTKARVEAVLESLRHGASRTAAAAGAGVSKDSLRRWMSADPGFAERVEIAEGEMVAALVDVIYRTALATDKNGNPTQQSWIAAMTLLERRMPEDWGRRDRIEISMEIRQIAEQIAAETGLPTDEVLAEAEQILRGRTAG